MAAPTSSGTIYRPPRGNLVRAPRCLLATRGRAMEAVHVSPFDRIKAIRSASGVSPTDRLVLLVLASYADTEGRCWPSVQRVADGCGLTQRSARRILRRLESAKLIRKDGKGRRGTTAYIVANPDTVSPRTQCPPGQSVPRTERPPGGDIDDTLGGDTVSPEVSIGEESMEESIVTALAAQQRRALDSAGLTTPEAVAALTRSELLKRPGVGPATAAAVIGWLAQHGLALRPEKPKAPKPSAKPWTDIWAEVWLDRRGTAYRFGEWWRASRDALAFAEGCRDDADEFRRCCGVFHGWVDSGDWKAKPPTLERARYKVEALRNETPPRRRGEYTGPTPEAAAENERRKQLFLADRAKRQAEAAK